MLTWLWQALASLLRLRREAGFRWIRKRFSPPASGVTWTRWEQELGRFEDEETRAL
jgi:hypothetical protein